MEEVTWSQTVKRGWYNNGAMLLEFNEAIAPYLADEVEKRGLQGLKILDVGFSKEFLFLRKILNTGIPPEQIFYFDKRERARNILKKQKGLEHIAFTTTPEDEGPYTIVSCAFAIHDCFGEKRKRGQGREERPIHTLEHLYNLLVPGGLIIVIDYDLPWTNNWPIPMNVLQVVMNAKEEKKIITRPQKIRKPTPKEEDARGSIVIVDHSEDVPGIATYVEFLRQESLGSKGKYEKNWVKAHNRYGRAEFLIDAEEVKFQQLKAVSLPKEHPDYPKLFMYIGRKSEN